MIVRQGVVQENLSRIFGIRIYAVKMCHAAHTNRWDTPPSLTVRAGLCDLLNHPKVGAPLANAVYVVAHELGHFRLATDDCTCANIYAVKHFNYLARRLGLSRLQAWRLWRLCPYR